MAEKMVGKKCKKKGQENVMEIDNDARKNGRKTIKKWAENDKKWAESDEYL
jgi:hypothetical protein